MSKQLVPERDIGTAFIIMIVLLFLGWIFFPKYIVEIQETGDFFLYAAMIFLAVIFIDAVFGQAISKTFKSPSRFNNFLFYGFIILIFISLYSTGYYTR